MLIGVMTIAGTMESMAAVKESTAAVKESTEGESERLRAIYGKNNDPHMIQLVLCINDSNFVCAAEEITKVKKWAFSMYETAATLHINRALAFVQYAAEHNIHAHTINRFKIIIAQACRSRGINYQNEQDYKGSIPYYEKAVEVMAGTVEKYHPDYAEMLSELGDTYDYVGMQKKAEPVLLEAYEIRKKILRKTDPAYVESLEALIFLYYRKKNYIKTDKYLREYAKLAENYLRGEAYEEAMGTIGEVYEEMGNEKKAEMYYSKAEARERDMYALFSPSDETNSQKSVDNDLYIRKRRAAIASFERYLENYDRDDILYGVFSTIIGGNYMEMGDWIRAEENLLEATEVFRHFEPDDIPSDSAKSLTTNSLYATMYALALDELGMLYQQTGDYPRAEHYMQEGYRIAKELLFHGENYDYGLGGLGLLYKDMGDYPKAKEYLTKAFEGCKARYGTDHFNYTLSLQNLGGLYLQSEDYPQAEKYLSEALDRYMKDSVVRAEHGMLWARCIHEAGRLNIAIKNYRKAKQYLSALTTYYKTLYGTDHPQYISCISDLGELYCRVGMYDKAEEYLIQARDSQKKSFTRSVDFMSETQRSRYWAMVKDRYERQYPLFCYRYRTQKPAIAGFAYDNELYTKGLLLSSVHAVRRSILESQDSILIQDWEKVMQLRNILRNMERRGSTTDSLQLFEQYAEEIEKEVTKESAFYRENMRQWAITWDSVRATLKPNQVAIEYMRAPLNEDSTIYCALLLRDTCSYPIMIPLFEEKEVSRLLKISNPTSVNRVYSYHENGQELCRLIWSKVLPYIHPGEIVFFAPTGLLHAVAMESIPYDSTRVISDVYNLVRLSSTRELAIHQPAIPHKTATLYGGISYDVSADELQAQSAAYPSLAFRSVINDTINRGRVGYLPGTKSEIEGIQTALSNKKVRVQTYTSSAANEESFKALSGTRQNILHIATHGFYWADSTNIDPMERSGLLLAGANMTLSGHSDRLPEGVQDGILTAKEISTLDLRETDIVVLSACETAQGVITGEGVFGLQRAFKMAGAKTIMMTLWKVNDDATQLLMNFFYRHYSRGMSKRQAFRLAQQEVRNYTGEGSSDDSKALMSGKERMQSKSNLTSHQPSEVSGQKSDVSRPYASPYYWAGFILLD